MPTLTPVPPRPAMPAAYEAKRSLYLADCARFNGKAEHYDDVLTTALCDLADTVSDALQLWMDAASAWRRYDAPTRLGIVPLRRPYAARRGFPAHMGRMARRLLPRSRCCAFDTQNYTALDAITERLSAMMAEHELLYGKMPPDVVLKGYGGMVNQTHQTVH